MNLKQIIRAECACYFRRGPYGVYDWCEKRDRVCIAFNDPGPCRYFQSYVLPAHPDAQAEYADMIGQKLPDEAVVTRRAVCGVCGEEFRTTSNRQRYCSAKCADEGRKLRGKERSKLHRKRSAAEVGSGVTI